MSAKSKRCRAKLESGYVCPNPGKGQREDRWLCVRHLKTYDVHGGAPKHWRWPKPKVLAVVAALENEPTSNAFLDDTPPPVWVDPGAGFHYPEEAPHAADVDLDPWDEQDIQLAGDQDEPPMAWVWWIGLGIAAVLLAFVLGAWWGRATADTDKAKAVLHSTTSADRRAAPKHHEPFASVDPAATLGTESAYQGAQAEAFSDAAATAASERAIAAVSQDVGSGDAAIRIAASGASDPALTDSPRYQHEVGCGQPGRYPAVMPDSIPSWIVQRESQHTLDAWNCSGDASGKYQFLRSTWAGYGGYSEAWMAPESVQDARAAEIWAGGAGCGHWSACGTSGDVPSAPSPLPEVPSAQIIYDQPVYYWWVSW